MNNYTIPLKIDNLDNYNSVDLELITICQKLDPNNTFYQQNLNKIKDLINNGANIYINNKKIITHVASLGSFEAFEIFINAGVNIYSYYPEIVHLCSKNGKESDFKILKLMFEKGYNIFYNESILVNAIKANSLDLVQFLLKKGEPFNIRDKLTTEELMDSLFKNYKSNPDIELVKFFIEQNFYIDYIEAIKLISMKNKPNILKLLIETNKQNTHVTKDLLQDILNFSLSISSGFGHIPNIQYLLSEGADIKYSEYITISNAISSPSLNVLEYFVNHCQVDIDLIFDIMNSKELTLKHEHLIQWVNTTKLKTDLTQKLNNTKQDNKKNKI